MKKVFKYIHYDFNLGRVPSGQEYKEPFLFLETNSDTDYLESTSEEEIGKGLEYLKPFEKTPIVFRAYTDIIPTIEQVLRDDLKYLGFKKQSPRYEKGIITEVDWLDSNGDMAVREVYSDQLTNGILTSIFVDMTYYAEDETVSFEKGFVKKEFNAGEATTEFRDRRYRQIDYLVASAVGTPIETYVNALFERYYSEVDKYKTKGTDEFELAVLNESEQPYLNYLAIQVDVVNGQPFTVKDSILNQVT